jgi:phage shock protein PspC (stress-responsive transcriptional regulator)
MSTISGIANAMNSNLNLISYSFVLNIAFYFQTHLIVLIYLCIVTLSYSRSWLIPTYYFSETIFTFMKIQQLIKSIFKSIYTNKKYIKSIKKKDNLIKIKSIQ